MPHDEHERAARLTKAHKVARVLRQHGVASRALLDAMPEEGWAMAEQLAGTRECSPITRQVVRSIIGQRERAVHA